MELELEEGSFIGMPFVLRSDGKWIKDSGSDFYVDFGDGFRQAQKVALYFYSPIVVICILYWP